MFYELATLTLPFGSAAQAANQVQAYCNAPQAGGELLGGLEQRHRRAEPDDRLARLCRPARSCRPSASAPSSAPAPSAAATSFSAWNSTATGGFRLDEAGAPQRRDGLGRTGVRNSAPTASSWPAGRPSTCGSRPCPCATRFRPAWWPWWRWTAHCGSPTSGLTLCCDARSQARSQAVAQGIRPPKVRPGVPGAPTWASTIGTAHRRVAAETERPRLLHGLPDGPPLQPARGGCAWPRPPGHAFAGLRPGPTRPAHRSSTCWETPRCCARPWPPAATPAWACLTWRLCESARVLIPSLYRPLFQARGAALGARAVLAAGDDTDRVRLAASYALACASRWHRSP